MRVTGAARIAAVLIGIEAAGVIGLAIWQAATLGDAASLPNALALLLLTLVGAVALAAFAVAVARGISWGRSGGIVAQALVFAVAVGAVTGTYPHWGVGIALAVPAVVVFALLLLAVRDAGRDARASRD